MSTVCAPRPLSGTQLQAVGALLAGRSPAETARDCGISPRTLHDWQRQPAFHAALLEGQARLLQETCLQLATAAAVAIRTLTEICQDTNQKGSVRAAAAGKLLDFLFRGTPQLTAALATAQPAATTPSSAVAQPAVTASPASAILKGMLQKLRGPATTPSAVAPTEAIFALPQPEPMTLPAVRPAP